MACAVQDRCSSFERSYEYFFKLRSLLGPLYRMVNPHEQGTIVQRSYLSSVCLGA